MVTRPYIMFSDQEIVIIKEKIDNKIDDWSKSIINNTRLESSLFQAYQIRETLNGYFSQATKDAELEVIIKSEFFVLKIISSSNEWLFNMGLATFNGLHEKKLSIYPDEVLIILNAVGKDISNTISSLYSGESEKLVSSKILDNPTVKGAGILFYGVKLHGLLIQFLIDGSQVKIRNKSREINNSLKPKVMESRLSACAQVTTNIKAFIGNLELSVGDLSKINSGDVIRLDASISDKVSLGATARQIICNGILGASNGQKALRIVS